eukprot:gene27407-33774_t
MEGSASTYEKLPIHSFPVSDEDGIPLVLYVGDRSLFLRGEEGTLISELSYSKLVSWLSHFPSSFLLQILQDDGSEQVTVLQVREGLPQTVESAVTAAVERLVDKPALAVAETPSEAPRREASSSGAAGWKKLKRRTFLGKLNTPQRAPGYLAGLGSPDIPPHSPPCLEAGNSSAQGDIGAYFPAMLSPSDSPK